MNGYLAINRKLNLIKFLPFPCSNNTFAFTVLKYKHHLAKFYDNFYLKTEKITLC